MQQRRRATKRERNKTADMTSAVVRMRGSPEVLDLVTRAMGGDKHAWGALVEQYIPLVWSICRRHQLDNADAREVSQTVWRQLAGQLGTFRNPAELSRWIACTAEWKCDRYRHAGPGPGQLPEAAHMSGECILLAEQELLVADRHAALREAFAHLPPHCQRLIAMLIQDPPVPEAEISAKLGIPVRSISQDRSSCLQQLRRYPAIATLIHSETTSRDSDLGCGGG
jgi:RNA polymerase sigma factor (sigma-70 family)